MSCAHERVFADGICIACGTRIKKQPDPIKLVILESPYAGDVQANKEYLIRCMRDSLLHGEAPMASHKLYTDVLDDNDPAERAQGIAAGLAWGKAAELSVFYIDRGFSKGMVEGMRNAIKAGRPMQFRMIEES